MKGLKNESNLKSNPSNSNTVTTNSTIPQPSLSIDEILKESVKTGQITPEELNKIHQVIGYDPNTRLKAINDTMNEKSSALESNKVVWEKLSSQLENLEQLRNIIPFTESNKNPYLQDYNHITDRNYLLDISKEKFQEANIEQAILASEANIQKFPDLSESIFSMYSLIFIYLYVVFTLGWRVLGECYAENEDDKKALYCLKKAVELDPFNLEAQLALGMTRFSQLLVRSY
jgi:peroxin-5